MYSSDDLVVAKLKGHDYRVTIFQYDEIIHHIDPEFTWMIHETVYNFTLDMKTNNYLVYDLFYRVAEKICVIIAEREKSEKIPSYRAVAEEMLNAYTTFTGNKKDKSPIELVNEFLIYGIKYSIIIIRYYNK